MSELDHTETVTLVMDWGNTVMQVFPEFSGPMASWPRVAEIDGVVEALEALQTSYRLDIATNAGDSKSEDVWKALRRVGLAEYFRAVFTSHELGSKKPNPRFFQQLESVLGQPARSLVMIGDDFRGDILGAKGAGWRAIWYNPSKQAAPGLLPLQDAEFTDMRDLPRLMDSRALPDYATCLAWLLERGITPRILAHTQVVATLAYQMAVWLRERGEAVDVVLTHRGGMLHDLDKADSIRRKQEQGDHGDHAQNACDLLMARGQPELAEIARRHALRLDPADPRKPLTWEQKLVHYADKLAEGSSLATLEERLEALKGRYPEAVDSITASWPALLALQQEICERLSLSPDELQARLGEALN